jgi:hypothetical protein
MPPDWRAIAKVRAAPTAGTGPRADLPAPDAARATSAPDGPIRGRRVPHPLWPAPTDKMPGKYQPKAA